MPETKRKSRYSSVLRPDDCPNCGYEIKREDHVDGWSGQCPNCTATLRRVGDPRRNDGIVPVDRWCLLGLPEFAPIEKDAEVKALDVGRAPNIYDRLMSLSRSDQQDSIIRRLLNGGFQMKTLDQGRGRFDIPFASSVQRVLIFRDDADQRWIVDWNGNIHLPGRTDWRIERPGS